MSVNLLTNDNPPKTWSDIYINRLTVYTDANINQNITTTNIDTETINGNPVGPLVPGIGTSGQFLRTNLLETGLEWHTFALDNIPHGASNQVMTMNALGTQPQWSSNIDIPGTLDVTGQTHLDSKLFVTGGAQITTGNFNVIAGDAVVVNGDLELQTGAATIAGNINNDFGGTASFTNENITGNLQFNGVNGLTGQYVKKTGPGTQAFSSFVVGDITPGSNGQIITTSGGVATWSNSSVLTSFMRFYNNTPRNVNTGTNIFATNGVVQYNTGSPFTFNVGTGTFACNISGTYTWTFNTIFDTHNAQSKFIISDGTTIQCAQQIDYVAGLTTAQPFSYTGTFPATIGQIWAVAFGSFGVGGVINTSGQDATFLCPTTTLEITRL